MSRLRGRWRLLLDLGQAFVEAGPRGRLRGPDGGRGLCDLRIVERSGAHEDEMRSDLRLAEQRGTAIWAEATVHDVAAVGDAAIVLHLAFDRDCVAGEADVHRAATGAEVLAQAAPADASDD